MKGLFSVVLFCLSLKVLAVYESLDQVYASYHFKTYDFTDIYTTPYRSKSQFLGERISSISYRSSDDDFIQDRNEFFPSSLLNCDQALCPLKHALSPIVKRSGIFPRRDQYYNCFSIALMFYQLTDEYSYMSDDEFWKYLDKSFQLLEPGSKILLGDLMTVHGTSSIRYQLYHSAVIIDQNILWHKRSANPLEPMTFEKLSSALGHYFETGPVNIQFWRLKNFGKSISN